MNDVFVGPFTVMVELSHSDHVNISILQELFRGLKFCKQETCCELIVKVIETSCSVYIDSIFVKRVSFLSVI